MLPEPHDTILVTVMPAPRDMEIARLLGWYRIPLRRAPRLVQVDYLAFYQPGSFGPRGGRIEFVAPVMGNELAVRAELLLEEPGHPRAREEYFKIQLGPLVRLSEPILAGRWRRFAFFYTTGEYLLRAESIDDLVVRGEDRRLVWQALRERAARPLERDAAYDLEAWPEQPSEALLDAVLSLVRRA